MSAGTPVASMWSMSLRFYFLRGDAGSYRAALEAIFFTIASTSLRSLSFRLVE